MKKELRNIVLGATLLGASISPAESEAGWFKRRRYTRSHTTQKYDTHTHNINTYNPKESKTPTYTKNKKTNDRRIRREHRIIQETLAETFFNYFGQILKTVAK